MGNKIYLRPISKTDTNNILKWRNSKQVKENFIYRKKLTEIQHQNWLDTIIEQKKAFQFIIVEKENNKDIGSVYLRDIDLENKKAEFGIFIGEADSMGKGFGTEATRLIVEYGFNELKLNKIFLRVFTENEQAINCYKRVGFREQGIFEQDVLIDADFKDIMFMAIFEKEGKI